MRPIDADRLKAVLEKNFGHTGGTSVLEQLIDEQPTIEPSTNCSEFPNNSDTVSRQAAIDLLKQMRKDGDMVPWEGKDVFARIRKLPTIQPEKAQLSQEGTTSDLISRQAAIDIFDDYNIAVENGELEAYSRDRKRLLGLPTIQPEPHEGHWIWVAGELMCSECRTIYSDLYPDYDNAVACPHCGAKMKGATP